MDDELDLRIYLRALVRRWHVVAAVGAAAALSTLIVSVYVITPSFEASTLLVLVGAQSRLSGSQPVIGVLPSGITTDFLIPFVHNEVVAAKAAARLPADLRADPLSLVGVVRFRPVGSTGLFRVTARHATARGAAALATAWADAVVVYMDDLASTEVRRALAVVEQKIASAGVELAESEAALRRFRSSSHLEVLNQQVQETVRQIALYEARLAVVEQGAAGAGGEVALRPGNGAYSLTVISLRDPARIRKLLDTLKSDLAALQTARAAEEQTETQLLRRVEAVRSTYQFLIQKREEFRLMLGANTGIVQIVVPATVPQTSTGPRLGLNLAIAVLLGLGLGAVAAIVIDAIRVQASTPTQMDVRYGGEQREHVS